MKFKWRAFRESAIISTVQNFHCGSFINLEIIIPIQHDRNWYITTYNISYYSCPVNSTDVATDFFNANTQFHLIMSISIYYFNVFWYSSFSVILVKGY